MKRHRASVMEISRRVAGGTSVLQRAVQIARKLHVEVRLEAFNLLNHFNWGAPVTNFAQATFGRVQSQATDPRILQFAMKLTF